MESLTMKKYLTRKNIKNADLISAFTRCPFGDPVEDCPFIPYYKLNNPAEQIRLMSTFSERELQQLRSHHQSCIALRQAQMILNRQKSGGKQN
jgi:hypothetical protein